jgi:hypothetical protein
MNLLWSWDNTNSVMVLALQKAIDLEYQLPPNLETFDFILIYRTICL